VVIQSDASLQGWGAVCNGTRTGGPWSQVEQEMHILSCLELLAATLAVQTFLKGQTAVSVLLQLDNQTAVVYINNLGRQYPHCWHSLRRSSGCGPYPRTLFLLRNTSRGSPIARQMSSPRPKQIERIGAYTLSYSEKSIFCGASWRWTTVFESRLLNQLPQFFSWKPDPLVGPQTPSVGSTERICESSMVSGWQSSFTSEEPECSGNSGGPSVEEPIVVFSSTRDAI